LGKWAANAEDAPGVQAPILSYPNPTAEEVKAISQRIYEKRDQRRKLGMLGRENVLNNFSAHRYLREHDQMLWIGKHRSPNYRATLRAHKKTLCNRSSAGSSTRRSATASGTWPGGSASATVEKKILAFRRQGICYRLAGRD
jgi:hypothetical protein